jgi:septum formation protein
MPRDNMPRKMTKSPQRRIILASSSPRRKELLRLLGLNFEVDPGNYEERMDLNMPPRTLARFLSRKKADAVAAKYKDAVVIAADTFILFREKLMGKPHTEEEASRMLEALNGKTHSVITGFTVIDTTTGKRVSKSVETRVSFKRLAAAEIESYVKTGEPLDKAGAYAIQGLGSVIVRKIDGDYFNVIGLPLSSFADALKKFGVPLL